MAEPLPNAADLTPVQLFTLIQSLSKTNSQTVWNRQIKQQFGEAVKAEEIALGVSQDPKFVGTVREIFQYDMHALGSPDFESISSVYSMIVEGLIRAINPSVIFCGGPASNLKTIALCSFGEKTYVENSIHLDYLERFLEVPQDWNYSVVSHADVESGTYPEPFDLACTSATTCSANREMLDALIDNSRTVLLGDSLDQGFLPLHGHAHDFSQMFTDLARREDISVTHIPIALGLTLITKL